MRHFFLHAVTAAVLVAMFFSAVPVQAQPVDSSAEHIEAFQADIAVHKDGSILVAERIEYVFPTQLHGIYRDIPIRYSIGGRMVRMPVEVKRVDRGGEPAPYTVEDNGNVVRVKIGDPNATVTGTQSYLVTYTVHGALRYFEDHDELYWNVTGNGWTVPIHRASAMVRTPDGSVGSLTHTCYTGPQGSTAQECLSRAEGETVSVVAEDALTIVVGWKPGLVEKLLPIADDWFAPSKLWPLLLPLAAAYWLYKRWFVRGRDPAGRGTMMVQYDPPGGLSPAETGGLVDGRVGAIEIVATIVDLAVHGHLKFVEFEKKGLLLSSKDIRIERLTTGKTVIKDYESRILDTLFSSYPTLSIIDVSDIKKHHLFDGKISDVSAQIDAALISAGYFPADVRKTPIVYIGIGVLFVFLGVLVAVSMVEGGWTVFTNFGAAAVLTGVMVAASGKAMVRHTEKGVLGREHALGFMEYLAKAEKYRLQWQEKEGVFEQFLPYAMVFGVADKWMKAFEGFDLKKPDWYEGSSLGGTSFNAGMLVGALSQMQSATVAAVMATKPAASSSGSGFSGGSSGGGGGGGGGGSW